MFAEVNICRNPNERKQRYSSRPERFQYIKLTYPNGVSLTLPSDIDAGQLERFIRIKV